MVNESYRILPGTNPFKVHSPEDVPADEILKLFVNVLADLSVFSNPGHAMLHGQRGSGKSMILRYLKPDCQSLARDRCPISELPFLGVYVGVKRSELGLTTEIRSDTRDSIDLLLVEHLMVVQVLCRLFKTLGDTLALDHVHFSPRQLSSFYNEVFRYEMSFVGIEVPEVAQDGLEWSVLLKAVSRTLDGLTRNISNYIKGFSLGRKKAVYTGPLCSYSETLINIVRGLRDAAVIPNGPVYLMIDDADILSYPMTMVLNSWIGQRTHVDVAIKATTQYRYKTLKTISGSPIETPHDYVELDTQQIYTSKHRRYFDLVTAMVKLRLAAAEIDASPEEFFRCDDEQEEQIEAIAKDLRNSWSKSGRGYQPSDDVARYARPNYIRSLRGTSKSGWSYSYSGFEQLVNLSSGVYRFFFEPATKMFDAQREKNQRDNGSSAVTFIDPAIQSEASREAANELLFRPFDKILEDVEEQIGGKEEVLQLQNLVQSLGGIFAAILNSDRSERRVTSIALSNQPATDVARILRLGVQTGYFAESTIGNKQGTGRTKRYILTRRLAPAFTLDPSGFAGYLFMSNEELRLCLREPGRAIQNFKATRLTGMDEDLQQGDLFSESEIFSPEVSGG